MDAAPWILFNAARVSLPGVPNEGASMNWQDIVKQIHQGGDVNYLEDRTSLRSARKLGLVGAGGKVRGEAYTLTQKGLDWIEGRLSIERKGNSAGMHQRATWLASLPQGLRL